MEKQLVVGVTSEEILQKFKETFDLKQDYEKAKIKIDELLEQVEEITEAND